MEPFFRRQSVCPPERETNGWFVVLCDNRGMALLLTIMVISLLVVITLQFGRESRQTMIASINLRDRGELDGIARSGIMFARAVLVRDLAENGFDCLHDSWNGLDEQTFPSFFRHGTLDLTVTDLSARFQINSLSDQSSEVLKRLLLSGEFNVESDSQVIEIIHALIDWIDSDSQQSDFGAENDYYQSLSPPYGCKNGPVEFIEELLLVKGITRELLYGSDGKKGLSDYITVHGDDGKINLNTADPIVIQALHREMTEKLAEDLSDYRAEEVNEENLSSSDWYKKIPAWPAALTLDTGLIGVQSTFFQIEATGVMGSLERRITEVVQRDATGDDPLVLLTRKVE